LPAVVTPAVPPGGWTVTAAGLAGPDLAGPDRVFAALADARRRELLELLARSPGVTAGRLAAMLPVSRQAVAQHLAVLEEAGLVSRATAGRQVLFTVRTDGLTDAAGWLTARAAAWNGRNRPADRAEDPLL
jgi:DNA-binding transcriptional ArsR family regulator